MSLPTRAPARPTGAWMLRHAVQMKRDPLTFLARTAPALGDVVELPVPGRPAYVVTAPAVAQRVLRDNHRAYGKRTLQYDTLALVTGRGLLTADLDPWRRHRAVQQPAFNHGALEPLVPAVMGAAERLLDRWRRAPDGSVVDVEAAMSRAALEVVGEVLFGADPGADLGADLGAATQPIAQAVSAALSGVLARAQNPLLPPLSVPTPGNVRMRRALAGIDRGVADLIQGRRRAAYRSDLLGLLLGSGLADEQVRDEAVTMLVAGHETVAAGLTWAWSLLGERPDLAEALGEEADSTLSVSFRLADVERLALSRRVVDETLRRYPPAWVVTRRALAADVLGQVQVPAGSLVIIGTHAMHHRPDIWPEPDRFDPSRFESLTPAQRQAYLPFGSGPRLCIGRDVALAEATLLLARLAQEFVLRPGRDGPVSPAAKVTLRPHGGLLMRLQPRHLRPAHMAG